MSNMNKPIAKKVAVDQDLESADRDTTINTG